MSGTPSKTGARLASLVVILAFCAVAYIISPMFLPRWRWENMNDWAELSRKLAVPAEKLQQTYDVTIRYNERGPKDPCPWQILVSSPVFDPENDEEKHAVRVTLLSDRTGEPPSALHLGSGNYRDLFFKARVWRLPPGAFGKNKSRPVLVYDGGTFDKLPSMEAYGWSGQMEAGGWTNDDEDIEDGYRKPGAPAAE